MAQLLDCDTLIGDPVSDANGETLGVLAHLLLDVTEGRIAYAVIGRGGVLGLGEKLHPVPWSAFTVDTDNRRLVLGIDGETLDRAPEFVPDDEPSFAEAPWGAVDRYYQNRA